jgi:hypothetical protein
MNYLLHPWLRRLFAAALVIGLSTASALFALSWHTPAQAGEFALAISPARFELALKPGERSRQVIEITNASRDATSLGVRTADWTLEENASVSFYDDLQPQSCRPWVALETRELKLSANSPYRMRFEIEIPASAPPGECRFAIMLEGQDLYNRPSSGPPIPFSARMGVIVYIAIGDAEPALSVVSASVSKVDGINMPMLEVHNSGLAHGRLQGFLKGIDANGVALEFNPGNQPILPGRTRLIPLSAVHIGDSDTAVAVQFPVRISGELEWGQGQSQKIEQLFSTP